MMPLQIFDRRIFRSVSWGLFLVTALLCGLGLMTLHSAVSADMTAGSSILFFKQWLWYGVGLATVGVVMLIDYRYFDRWAYLIYGGGILLLTLVLVFGKTGGGSQRWLSVGPVTVQPSEVVKIAVIIVLSRYYSRRVSEEGLSLRDLAVPGLLLLLPFSLIVRQPDLGTAMVVMLIGGTLTLFAKIERRTLTALSVLAAGILFSGWFFLKDYQKKRIITFLDPGQDPLGAGYHIIQSKIAIGSGMMTGKGFRQGTQNMLSFLPEQHTDFIFSVLAEEWGFVGGAFIQFLFMVLIIWGLNIAYNCRNPFGTLLSVGVTTMIFWQAVINLCMVMGLMPVVGVPLPLISYGGSSILTVMICIGVLLNVNMRRYSID